MIAFNFLEQPSSAGHNTSLLLSLKLGRHCPILRPRQTSEVDYTPGVKQVDLGISGGLAGIGRYAGGPLAQAIYVSIFSNTQASRAAATVPAAAIKVGLPQSSTSQFLAAFSFGIAALEAVPGVTPEILVAAGDAFKWSYAHGLKRVIHFEQNLKVTS